MSANISNNIGTIIIQDSVIATIAGVSAMETYGIVGMAAKNATDGLFELLKFENLTRGIKVSSESDLELAMQHARRKEYKHFICTGFLGGRISHELFNIEFFKHLKEMGCNISLREKGARMEFMKAGEVLKIPEGIRVSILPARESKINLKGFRWNVKDRLVRPGSTLTLSNETIRTSYIHVSSGMVTVIMESLKERGK